jgi:hypothetical protein
MSRHRPSRAPWHCAALLASLLLGGCGSPGTDVPAEGPEGAAATPSPQPSKRPTPQEGELLLAAPPPGWVETAAMQTPALRMAEFGPAQPAEGELERLTVEAQPGQPLPDPIEFVLAVSRDLEARCQGFQNINISSGHENGYPTSVRLMICPKFRDAPQGQVVMAKAIQGDEQFYVVTRRLQVPAMQGRGQPLTAQAMAQWSTHLKAVQVCNTRSAKHPCPEFSAAPP